MSPKTGRQKHYWLGPAKGKSSSALKNLILEQLPATKESDIDLMLATQTKEEIINFLRSTGLEETKIKLLSK